VIRQQDVPEPVLARSRDAVFFHYRCWPADAAALLRRLSERSLSEHPCYVTLPWDLVPPAPLDDLEEAIRQTGARLRFIEYGSATPEADELGFRLAQTLHEGAAQAATAQVATAGGATS
jgi:hypothetical protein